MAGRGLPTALLLTLLAVLAAGQEIRLVGGPGCLDVPPAPPSNLRAEPQPDGSMRLSWDKPANGACVTTYEINIVAVDGAKRFAPQQQRTPQFSVSISGLENGQQYRFFVKAFSARFNGGGEAVVVATARAACNPQQTPSAPTNLSATAGDRNVTLCWGPPTVNGCVDEWRVAVRIANDPQRSSPSILRFNTGACATISKLDNGVSYAFSVQAWSKTTQQGGFASVMATPVAPAKPWTCFPVPGSYPLCAEASRGRCGPMSCRQQAAAGQCGAPFMRFTDAATRTVVQYCADVCGCDASPSAAVSTPGVRAFDQAVRASADNQCCATPARRDFGMYTQPEEEEVATVGELSFAP